MMDPIPTSWHVAAILTVPGSCLWAWWSLGRRDSAPRALVHLNAFALGVAVAYSIGFLPAMPLAIFGCIFFGFGLLPLSPVLAILPLLSVRAALERGFECGKGARKPPAMWPAGVLAFSLLAFGVLHYSLTASLLQTATSEDAAASRRAISALRWMGDERAMLDACYGDVGRTEMFTGWTIDAQKARAVYFRTTGQSFDSKPVPASASNRMFGRGRWNFDPSLGQDRVANQVPDLFLAESRMDVKVDAKAATAYEEWTLVFRNDALNASEARALVELPPGGVVSRLTLWINGEPREAAFGGRAQVRAAYQEVAVAQRRDPVLVTTAGEDRVLMQCFPVPPNGGEMKVRIGITAPLRIPSVESGILDLPRFVEVNFASAAGLKHHIAAESDGPLRLGAAVGSLVLATLDDATIREGGVLSVSRTSAPPVVFADHISDPALAIRQTLASVQTERPSRVVFVIDGSRPAAVAREKFAKAVGELPDGMLFAVVFAADEVEVHETAGANPRSRSAASRWLDARNFSGGQDNIPGLVRAWDIASAEADSAIVWMHASQPEVLSALAPIEQRMERSASNAPRVFLVPLASGPNRIAEKLDSVRPLRNLRAITLPGWMQSWGGKVPVIALKREVVSASEVPVDAIRADRHVARLWAHGEVRRLIEESAGAEAQKLAVAGQLVTPVSGAVVLETQAQFDRHGLSPVDPATVPVVPEPGSAALLLGGMLCLTLRRFRQRRS
ncbi:MAG: hypothetical protein RL088_2104 [Verrucomicrobiota bacterium]